MLFRVRFCVFALLIVFASSAGAQIDPSSALLLNNGINNGNRTNTRESGIDSGRYTVHPKDSTSHHEDRSSHHSQDVDDTDTVVQAGDSIPHASPTPQPSPSPAPLPV